jgi:hypothetical protein
MTVSRQPDPAAAPEVVVRPYFDDYLAEPLDFDS